MSSSYVEYRGNGFWSWDGYLEHTLALLAKETPPDQPAQWLEEAQQHWRRQSSGVFAAWVHPSFDEFVSTDDRRQVVLALLQAVARRPDATPEARATIDLLCALLRGELKTHAGSPMDYMVSGKQPYAWISEREAARQ